MKMKKCEDCDYFEGFDDVGYPACEVGSESCPYNDEEETEMSEDVITIKLDRIKEYISDTVRNSLRDSIRQEVGGQIRELVKKQFEELQKDYTEEVTKKQIDGFIAEFMEGTIKVGGGWLEEARELTRKAYVQETIEKNLSTSYSQEMFTDMINSDVKRELESIAKTLKSNVNTGVKQIFDQAMQQTLTDSVVNVLMCNDTYKRLSSSMQNLLP